MSKGLNKVIIMGNLGADPDVRYMPNGSAVTKISVATSEQWNDKKSNDKQERTEWHKVVLFNRLGEIASQYLHKGSRVFVEGAIRTNKWTDQAGVERYTTEIVASSLQMLDTKEAGGIIADKPPETQPKASYEQDKKAYERACEDDDIPF